MALSHCGFLIYNLGRVTPTIAYCRAPLPEQANFWTPKGVTEQLICFDSTDRTNSEDLLAFPQLGPNHFPGIPYSMIQKTAHL